MTDTFPSNDRDRIARLFDLAMVEMKRRRPDLRDKADSDILEILEREYGPTGPSDLADLAKFLDCDN